MHSSRSEGQNTHDRIRTERERERERERETERERERERGRRGGGRRQRAKERNRELIIIFFRSIMISCSPCNGRHSLTRPNGFNMSGSDSELAYHSIVRVKAK